MCEKPMKKWCLLSHIVNTCAYDSPNCTQLITDTQCKLAPNSNHTLITNAWTEYGVERGGRFIEL